MAPGLRMEQDNGQRSGDERRTERIAHVQLAPMNAGGDRDDQGKQMADKCPVEHVLEAVPAEHQAEHGGQSHVAEAEDDEGRGTFRVTNQMPKNALANKAAPATAVARGPSPTPPTRRRGGRQRRRRG